MSKSITEVAAEMTQEVIKAKAQVIASIDSGQALLIDKYLNDAAIVNTYRAMLNVLVKG